MYPPSVRKGECQLRLGYKSASRPYLEWLHQQLAPLGMNPIKPKKGYQQFYCWSKPSLELAQYYPLFYPQGKKEVPATIEQLLCHPAALAVWYMDDGTLDERAGDHRSVSISTYNFSFPDCHRLSSVLLRNFGIKSSVHKTTMRGKPYPRLFVLSASTDEFLEQVRPYIQPCFAYKLGNGQQPR